MHQASLPKNFAQQVLDLEGEIDFNCELSTVKRLIELYTAAIEFYEAVQNNKYLHYQRRLQQLLDNTEIQSLLDDSLVKKPRFFSPPHSHIKKTAQKVVEHHFVQSHNVMTRVRQNLRSQESIENRLEARRRSHSIKRNASPNSFIVLN